MHLALFAAAKISKDLQRARFCYRAMEKWRPPSPEGLVESHPVVWAEELGLKDTQIPVWCCPCFIIFIIILQPPHPVLAHSLHSHDKITKDMNTFVFTSPSPADTRSFFKHFGVVILQLTANVLLMTLSGCQGYEDISRTLGSASLSFLFVCQFPPRDPNVHQPHLRSSPRYSRVIPTPTDTTHLTTARAHWASLPLSKFQAAARQSPTSVYFRGRKRVLFARFCQSLSP